MVFSAEPTSPIESPGLLAATSRFRSLLVLMTLAGTIAGLSFALIAPERPSASARLTLTDPRGTTIFHDGGAVQVDVARYLSDRAEFASSASVLSRAAERFGKEVSAEDLRRACSVADVSESNTIAVSCEMDKADQALEAADSVDAAFQELTVSQVNEKAEEAIEPLRAERDEIAGELASGTLIPSGASSIVETAVVQSATGRITALDQRMTEIRTTQALFGDGVEYLDEARVVPTAGWLVRALKLGIVGAGLGFFAALALAWFRADRQPIAQRSAEVVELLGMPLLGQIEVYRDTPTSIDLLAKPEAQFELLSSSFGAVFSRGIALFVPVVPTVGSVGAIVNSALVAVRSGRRVLLIDGDASDSAVGDQIGLQRNVGLAELLSGKASLESATARMSFGQTAGLSAAVFDVMGPGLAGSDLAALASTPHAEEAMINLRSHYDLVFVASPALLSSGAATALGRLADGVVVILEQGMSTATIANARRQLGFVPADALGFVMIDLV